MKKLLMALLLLIITIPFTVKGDSTVIYSETIDSINGVRYENHLVYFSDSNQDVSGTNVWGYEVAVDKNNVVVEANSNVKMVRNGYILSAHGTKKIDLQKVQVGDIVEVDLDALTVVIYRDPIQSSYLLSLSNKEKANASYNKALQNLYEVNDDRINLLLSQINSRFDEMTDIYQSEEIDAAMETRLVTLAFEIQGRTEEVIYMTSKTRTIDIRAVWHRPNATAIKENNLEGLRNLMDRFSELGFNTIYVESFWNGYVSGRSEVLDTHPNIASFYYGEEYGNDYLKAFITEANLRGIDVHAWVHTFNAGNASNLSSAIKNEWLVENYQGVTLHPNAYGGSYYLDPSNQEVLDFVLEMLKEMMEDYAFAGMQLDYIRYYDNNYSTLPIRDSGYNDLAETKFKTEYDLSGDVRTLILDTQNRSYWFEWRQNNINNAVKYFSDNLREIVPEIIISADVVGDLSQARNIYMQDWLTWVRAGHIDLLCPMIYTGSNDRLESLSLDIFEKLGNFSFLSSGIAPIYYGYSIYNQHEQIVIASRTGGSAIFASHNIIGDAQVEKSLRDGTFRNEAISPFAKMSLIVDMTLMRVENLLEENLDNQVIKDMFFSHIEKIREVEYLNPGQYQIGLDKIVFMRQLTPYITDEVLSQIVTEELTNLEHVLDVRITRELIALGLYTPSEENRPNPLDFEYETEEPGEEEPGEEEPGEEEPGEEEPGDNNPIDEEPVDEDLEEEQDKLSLLTYIIPATTLLLTLVFIVMNLVLKRRKL